jgi:hypothetical protein
LFAQRATVLEIERHARDGDCAVMIHAPTQHDANSVMEVVHTLPFSYGTRYRTLVIEDLD